MGIHNLNKFLRNNCPNIYEEIHISEYSFKKVAIDISLYLCKFKTICGDKWLSAFLNLISCLRKNEVHCVFIYDSGAPPEKEAERKERLSHRIKLEEKVYKLEEALEKFYLTNELDNLLINTYNKQSKKMTPLNLMCNRAKNEINIEVIKDTIKKMRGQILDIKPEDFQKTKELFDILKVPYFNAPLEAETMCADLCKRGLVDAALSEDTDVLAYAAPIFLSKINTTNGTCTKINYNKMLENLKISSDTFLDLCIMCGTDYNKNIYKIGPEKAYKYLQKYENIENIESNTKLDIKILNHKRGRELFRNYEQKNIKIPYCGVPDFKQLELFVVKNNITCSIEGLKKSFVHQTLIIFEDDSPNIKIVDDQNCNDTVIVKIEKK